jgi:hypothetical protein
MQQYSKCFEKEYRDTAQLLRQEGKKVTQENMLSVVNRIIKLSEKNNPLPDTVDKNPAAGFFPSKILYDMAVEMHPQETCDYNLMDLFHAELTGQSRHYYIDSHELADFLREAPVRDTKDVAQVIRDCGEKIAEDIHSVYFSVHAPGEADGWSYKMIAFGHGEESENNLRIICKHNGQIGSSLGIWNNDTDQRKNTFNIAANILFYISAFPECVKPGVPKGVRVDSPVINRNVTVRISDKIVTCEKSKDGRVVTPHFRRGHFRYLASDFYTKMRGKYVFIESTIVKGRDAETVIGSEKNENAMAAGKAAVEQKTVRKERALDFIDREKREVIRTNAR